MTDTINAVGTTPLINILRNLGGWPVLGSNPGGDWVQDLFDFEKLWANLSSQYSTNAIISSGVQPNANYTAHILWVNAFVRAASMNL